MAGAQRRMGRPLVADVEEVRERALSVILANGYEQVTMARIADASGVSLRTLHRYFPSKADIVWGSVDTSIDELRDALAHAPAGTSVISAVARAVEASFAAGGQAVGSARERLRLIASEPSLQRVRSTTFTAWHSELLRFIARRLDAPIDDVGVATAASALQSAIMAALAWWARHDDSTDPGEVVAEALRALKDLTEK